MRHRPSARRLYRFVRFTPAYISMTLYNPFLQPWTTVGIFLLSWCYHVYVSVSVTSTSMRAWLPPTGRCADALINPTAIPLSVFQRCTLTMQIHKLIHMNSQELVVARCGFTTNSTNNLHHSEYIHSNLHDYAKRTKCKQKQTPLPFGSEQNNNKSQFPRNCLIYR